MVKYWHKHLSNISDTATIGDNSIIHSHVWIGDRVSIGKNCRMQAFAFVPTGVRIGDNVFIGPHVCFTNDRHPPSDNWEITIVMDGAVIGANATILPGVTLGKNCMVGAGSLVTRDVPEGETWVGNPAKKYGDKT